MSRFALGVASAGSSACGIKEGYWRTRTSVALDCKFPCARGGGMITFRVGIAGSRRADHAIGRLHASRRRAELRVATVDGAVQRVRR